MGDANEPSGQSTAYVKSQENGHAPILGSARKYWAGMGVWDRVKRGPALVDGRALAVVSRRCLRCHCTIERTELQQQESADAICVAGELERHNSGLPRRARREKLGTGARHERVLGFRETIEGTIAEGTIAARRVEPDQMEDWLLD
jgi:hypothetical protein